MKNFKKMWEENIDGLEDLKGVEIGMNGFFVDNNGEFITVLGGCSQAPELDAWFTEDYCEFLKMNDDFMNLDADIAEDVFNDVPEFVDYV